MAHFQYKEIYLIPYNYRGKVVVVFGRPFGDSAKALDSSTVYQIPNDGILVIRNVSHLDYGLKNSEFYLVDTSGKRTQLSILEKDSLFNSRDSTKLKREVGIIPFGIVGSCKFDQPNAFCYFDFYIGSQVEMDKYYTPDMADDFEKRLLVKAHWLQK